MSKLFPVIRNVVFPNDSFTFCQVRWLPRWQHRRPGRVIAAEDYDENTDSKKKITDDSQEIFMESESIQRPDESIEAHNYGDITDIKKKKYQSNPKPMKESYEKIAWKQPKADKKVSEISTNQRISPHKAPLTISKSGQLEKVKTYVDMLETVIDEDGNFIYTKMKNKDTRIVSILTEIKSKREKEKNDLMLLEGKRLIKDALDAGCNLKYIIFSRPKEVEYLKPSLPKYGVSLYKMPYSEMQDWSGLTTTPGVMGKFSDQILLWCYFL